MFFLDPQFLKAATERAVKTAFQMLALAYFAGDKLFDVFAADWQTMGGVFLGGLVASYVTSFASGFVGERETPSVGGETLTEPSEPDALPQGFLDDLAGERPNDEHREG